VNACFGDRDGLLFHGFVNRSLIFRVHLVEVVDTANTIVGKHECSCLDAVLTRIDVFAD
jgi:hypothetical protein